MGSGEWKCIEGFFVYFSNIILASMWKMVCKVVHVEARETLSIIQAMVKIETKAPAIEIEEWAQNEDYLRKLYQYQLGGRKRGLFFLCLTKFMLGKGVWANLGERNLFLCIYIYSLNEHLYSTVTVSLGMWKNELRFALSFSQHSGRPYRNYYNIIKWVP